MEAMRENRRLVGPRGRKKNNSLLCHRHLVVRGIPMEATLHKTTLCFAGRSERRAAGYKRDKLMIQKKSFTDILEIY